ncbi:MAG: SLBB domain-containing protein [Candidatus Eisenbacteria bacterium]
MFQKRPWRAGACTILLLLASLLACTLSGNAGAQTPAAPPGTAGDSQPGTLGTTPLPRPLEGPVDRSAYRLGPGDLLSLRVRATPPVERTLRVTPDGYLILPEGPSVHVAGLTIEQANDLLRDTMSRYYRSGEVDLHLLELRTITAYVLGEVRKPGLQQATPNDRASELVTRAEPFEIGQRELEQAAAAPLTSLAGSAQPRRSSQRAIRLLRQDGNVLPVDLALFEATGALIHNPTVEAGDRIVVPPYVATAVVSGAVRKPGPVEVVPGDSVGTLLALAHGLDEEAMPDSAYLQSGGSRDAPRPRRLLDLRNPADRAMLVGPGDLLFVRPRVERSEGRTVRVIGEVRNPGMHALPTDSLLLTQLIADVGGFTPTAALGEAYVTRDIPEAVPDPEYDRLRQLPTGEMTPEEFQYYSMRLRTSRPVLSVDFPALFLEGDRSQDVYVRPGDLVVVPKIQPFVTVAGEVRRPGNVPFLAGEEIDRYVERSGGYTDQADKGKVTVVRALTGQWIKKGKVDRLGPGDTIWVPRKPQRDLWKSALTTLGVLSQLATIYLVIDSAAK